MADILNELTGRASGKVGNLVYRITNGKTSLCSPPLKPKASTKPEVIARKNKFKMACRLASAINHLLFLKYFWKNVGTTSTDDHKSAFSRMIKKNYSLVSDTDLTNLTYVVPTFGFGVTSTAIELTNTEINVTLAALGTDTGINLAVETSAVLACILFAKTPVIDESLAPYEFIWQLSDQQVLSLTNPLSFTAPLSGSKKEIFDAYTTKKAFFALITLDADGNPVQFSTTFHSA